MKILEEDRNRIRRMLMFELNSTFVRVSKQLTAEGAGEGQKEYLQKLIEDVKECVKGPNDNNERC